MSSPETQLYSHEEPLQRLGGVLGLSDEQMADPIWDAAAMMTYVAAFTDGEVYFQHEVSDDPAFIHRFGSSSCADGALYKDLRRLRRIPQAVHVVDEAAAVCGAYAGFDTATHRSVAFDFSERPATVLIQNDQLWFDGVTVQLDGPPAKVMDYGPGLEGRNHLDWQLESVKRGRSPIYFAVAKGAFIPEFLSTYLRYIDPAAQKDRQHPFVEEGRTMLSGGGIADDSARLLGGWRERGTEPDLDLTICSGAYGAGHEQINAGLKNAYDLMRSGGTLLLSNPVSPRAAYVSAEQGLRMAKEIGFRADKAQIHEVTRYRHAWVSAVLKK